MSEKNISLEMQDNDFFQLGKVQGFLVHLKELIEFDREEEVKESIIWLHRFTQKLLEKANEQT